MTVIGFRRSDADLFGGVLNRIEGVGGRGYTSRRHDLDERRSVAQFAANRQPDCVGSVGHVRKLVRVNLAGTQASLRRGDIAVSAGLGQRPTGPHDPRPVTQAPIDGAHQPLRIAPGVAHRGEPSLKHGFGELPHPERPLDRRHFHESTEIHRGDDVMHVSVDEPRHDEAPPGVDLAVGIELRQ